jgi:hypothetical protein
MPRKTTLNKYLTSKLQVSPNFTLDSVADSNYRGKCDVGGFLIFEWTLCTIGGHIQNLLIVSQTFELSLKIKIVIKELNFNLMFLTICH